MSIIKKINWLKKVIAEDFDNQIESKKNDYEKMLLENSIIDIDMNKMLYDTRVSIKKTVSLKKYNEEREQGLKSHTSQFNDILKRGTFMEESEFLSFNYNADSDFIEDTKLYSYFKTLDELEKLSFQVAKEEKNDKNIENQIQQSLEKLETPKLDKNTVFKNNLYLLRYACGDNSMCLVKDFFRGKFIIKQLKIGFFISCIVCGALFLMGVFGNNFVNMIPWLLSIPFAYYLFSIVFRKFLSGPFSRVIAHIFKPLYRNYINKIYSTKQATLNSKINQFKGKNQSKIQEINNEFEIFINICNDNKKLYEQIAEKLNTMPEELWRYNRNDILERLSYNNSIVDAIAEIQYEESVYREEREEIAEKNLAKKLEKLEFLESINKIKDNQKNIIEGQNRSNNLKEQLVEESKKYNQTIEEYKDIIKDLENKL